MSILKLEYRISDLEYEYIVKLEYTTTQDGDVFSSQLWTTQELSLEVTVWRPRSQGET